MHEQYVPTVRLRSHAGASLSQYGHGSRDHLGLTKRGNYTTKISSEGGSDAGQFSSYFILSSFVSLYLYIILHDNHKLLSINLIIIRIIRMIRCMNVIIITSCVLINVMITPICITLLLVVLC